MLWYSHVYLFCLHWKNTKNLRKKNQNLHRTTKMETHLWQVTGAGNIEITLAAS